MNVERNVLNSKKEIVNQKIKNRTYLDTIEKRKLITLNLTDRSQPILAHLIEKYIYFFNSTLLNSKGEFYQSYDDIALGVISNLSYHLMKKSLDELTEKGYITRVLKTPEGAKTNIPKYHFILNYDKLDEILISPEEYKLPNKKKYEMQQDIKYKATPTKPAVKSTEEITEVKTVESIQEPTEIKEPLKEPVKRSEDLDENRAKTRAKAKAIIDSKSNPKIKDYLDKLRLTNYDIHYLLSSDYVDGSDKDLDDKKRILNLMVDNLIEVHI